MFLLLSITLSSYAQPLFVGHTPFKSAIVLANYAGRQEHYKAKIFIAKYGEQIAADIRSKRNDQRSDIRIIIKDGFRYKLDIEKKRVTKTPYQQMAKTKMKKSAEDTVLNYLCEVYTDTIRNRKCWLHKEFPMKVVDSTQHMHYEVEKIKENASIPSNIFLIPDEFMMKSINYNFD